VKVFSDREDLVTFPQKTTSSVKINIDTNTQDAIKAFDSLTESIKKIGDQAQESLNKLKELNTSQAKPST